MEVFSQIDLLGVLIANIVGFLFGWLWFSPLLFVNTWLKEIGLKPEDFKYSPVQAMGTAFVVGLIVSFFLAFFVHYLGIDSLKVGIMFAMTLAFGIIFPPFISDGMFNSQSFKLMLINGGYRALHIAIMTLTYIIYMF